MSFSHDFRGGHVAHAHTEGQPLEPHGRYTSQARLNPIATMREVCWAHCRAAQRASMRDRGFGQSCPRGPLFRTATNTGPLHPSGIRYFSNVTSAAVPDLDHELVDGASSVTTRRQGGPLPGPTRWNDWMRRSNPLRMPDWEVQQCPGQGCKDELTCSIGPDEALVVVVGVCRVWGEYREAPRRTSMASSSMYDLTRRAPPSSPFDMRLRGVDSPVSSVHGGGRMAHSRAQTRPRPQPSAGTWLRRPAVPSVESKICRWPVIWPASSADGLHAPHQRPGHLRRDRSGR